MNTKSLILFKIVIQINQKHSIDCKVPLLPQTLSSECTSLAFSTSNSSTLGSNIRKGSLRGNKLAKRARSFKDDFFEKISQIRTPTNTMAR